MICNEKCDNFFLAIFTFGFIAVVIESLVLLFSRFSNFVFLTEFFK